VNPKALNRFSGFPAGQITDAVSGKPTQLAAIVFFCLTGKFTKAEGLDGGSRRFIIAFHQAGLLGQSDS
jgi:hypothetical protein